MAAVLPNPALPSHADHPVRVSLGVTADEFFGLPEDERRLELYDGELWMSPNPSGRHQRLAYLLGALIGPVVVERGLGILYTSPISLRIGANRVVAPDLCIISNDHPQADDDDWVYLLHPPSLVVEIVSPSTRRRDWSTKLEYYAEFGVPNYWIVEAAESMIYAHSLQHGGYEEVVQTLPGTFVAPPLTNFAIDLRRLFGQK